MKKIRKNSLILLACALLLVSCNENENLAEEQKPTCTMHYDLNHDGKCDNCGTGGLTVNHIDVNKDGYCDTCHANMPLPPFKIQNKLNGADYNLNNTRIQEYMSCQDTSEGYKQMAALFAEYKNKTQIKTNNPLTLSWNDETNSSPYTIQFSLKENFDEILYEESGLIESSFVVDNFIPGKYYYRIKNSADRFSDTDSFNLSNQVRMISGLSNTRDMGGWKIGNNKRIKYGLVYRGGEIFANCDDIYSTLNIKSDIDLRKSSTVAITSPAPSIDNYIYAGLSAFDIMIPQDNPVKEQIHNQYGDLLQYNSYSEASVNGLKNGLLAYADTSTMPSLVHCTGGADRTGTFCFILESLLGVSYEDACRDYELTTICIGGMRVRSDYDSNGFTDLGFVPQSKSSVYCALGIFYKEILYYGNEGDSLQVCMENYVKQVVGLTDANIQAIRNNLIENI